MYWSRVKILTMMEIVGDTLLLNIYAQSVKDIRVCAAIICSTDLFGRYENIKLLQLVEPLGEVTCGVFLKKALRVVQPLHIILEIRFFHFVNPLIRRYKDKGRTVKH